jgi:hypothetical protein
MWEIWQHVRTDAKNVIPKNLSVAQVSHDILLRASLNNKGLPMTLRASFAAQAVSQSKTLCTLASEAFAWHGVRCYRMYSERKLGDRKRSHLCRFQLKKDRIVDVDLKWLGGRPRLRRLRLTTDLTKDAATSLECGGATGRSRLKYKYFKV